MRRFNGFVKRTGQLCRQAYARIGRALNPVFVAVARNIGPNEVLGLASLAVLALGLSLIWFPLAPICIGLSGLAIAVINARMRS